MAGQYVFPLAGTGWRWGGGVAEHQKRPLGNWQSDNAVDIMAPSGTLFVAPVSGRVKKISGRSPSLGQKGTTFGRSVTIEDAQGREWFGTHLDDPFVRVGQFVTAGAPVSRIADWGDNSHLHLGVSEGDPRALLSGVKQLPGAAADAAGAAASGVGCLTVLLVQLTATAAGVVALVEVIR